MKNGHIDICHLSYLDDISPKQRDSGLWKEKNWGGKGPANCCPAQDTFSEMMLISQSITRFAK